MQPGGIGYSDTPTFGGFSSKSPCSDHAMELGDMEAAFVGNLARYCMVIGTIPRHSLKGLWWVNGECKGISTTGPQAIQGLINHLIYWAPYIIGTEGVDELLRAGEETRWYSERLSPQETERWVGIEEAERITGRKARTIRRWKEEGWIETLDDSWGVMYSKNGLETVLAAMNGKRTSNLPNGQAMLH